MSCSPACLYLSVCSRLLRVAECIVMLLGQVAVEVKGQHDVIGTVVAIFQQRLFHPTSNLDGNIVIELGKMAAQTGVSRPNNVPQRTIYSVFFPAESKFCK